MDSGKKSKPTITAGGVFTIIAGALFIGGQAAVIIARNREIAAHNGTPVDSPAFTFIGNALWVAIGVFIILLVLRAPALLRDRRLRAANPGATVLSSGRTDGIGQKLSRFGLKDDLPAAKSRLPMTFSIVADERGVDLRAGSPNYPAIFHIPWKSITRVEAGQVEESARRSNALIFHIDDQGVAQVVGLVIVGRGLFGAFPLKRETLEVVAKEFTSKATG